MSKRAGLASVCASALLVASCMGSKPKPALPAATPAPPPPPIEAPTPPPPAIGPVAPQMDAVDRLVAEAERHFNTGQDELKQGHLTKARAEFDLAVGVLLDAPQGAKGEPRLRVEYDAVLSRIAALEVTALRQGDGFSESRTEPAAIDALLAVATFPPATPKTENAVANEIEAVAYDLPVISNDKVLSYVELFQGNLHDFLQEGLIRGSKYLPRIREVFKQEGLPLDLAYVPLIESAYKSTAYSRARAKGMWQFELPTAGDYDLKFDWFIDERSDFEKSTAAAAKHLKMLYNMFDGDWNLALASYNVGQGKVLNAIKRAKTSDYWKLTSSTKYLPRDTRAYVPMIWAAIIIAKSPEQFGFTVDEEPALAFDTVTVPDAIRLDVVAEWAGTTVDGLRELNPELRRLTTPMGPHELRVPAGTKDAVEKALAGADPSAFTTFVRHKVKAGETLLSIARRYKITRADLAEANHLRTSAKLRQGQSLFVPGAVATAAPAATAAADADDSTRKSSGGSSSVTYRVKAGDSLFGIARHFGVTVDELKRWNRLNTNTLSIGKTLKIFRN